MGKRCFAWIVLACVPAACAGDADAPGPQSVASVLEDTHGAATDIIHDAGTQFSVGAFIARQNAQLLIPLLAAVSEATQGKAVRDLNDVQQSFLNGTFNAADDMRRSERYPRRKAMAMLAQADALLSTLSETYRYPRVLDFNPRYVIAPAASTALDLVISGHALDASGPELTVQGKACELRGTSAEQLRFHCMLPASPDTHVLSYLAATLSTLPPRPWWAVLTDWMRPAAKPVRYTLALALIPRTVGSFEGTVRVSSAGIGMEVDAPAEASVPLTVGDVAWGGTREIALPGGAIFVTLRGRQADGRVYEDTSNASTPHPWYATTIDLKARHVVIRARGLDEALAQP